MKKSDWLVLSIMFCCIVGVGTGITAAPADSSENIRYSTDTTVTTEGAVPDSGGAGSTPVVFELCTLTVITTPESAAVTLDGTLFGTTPLVISNIDTGAHVLVLSKSGYYRKKVAFSLPSSGASSLSFALNAPGLLIVASEPEGAVVTINGKERGTTPFTDSLLKPGTCRVVLTKDGFLSSERTVEIRGGVTVAVSDTLRRAATPASTKSTEKTPRKKRKRFTVGIVTGVFSLFLLVLALIELGE